MIARIVKIITVVRRVCGSDLAWREGHARQMIGLYFRAAVLLMSSTALESFSCRLVRKAIEPSIEAAAVPWARSINLSSEEIETRQRYLR
jgi:hypothetical protein